MINKSILFFIILLVLLGNHTIAQTDTSQVKKTDELIMDYRNPIQYTLAGIEVKGNENINENIIIAFTGLKIGQSISVPGEEISTAIKNLWKQKLFSDVQVKVNKISDKNIFLQIELKTRPRLSKYKIEGVSKNEASNIREEITLIRGDIITEQLVSNVKRNIRQYFHDKGFLKADIKVEEEPDTLFANNSSILRIHIDKKKKVKIDDITFSGNTEVKDGKLRRVMKETKKQSLLNIFKSSKFIEEYYETDKRNLISYYRTLGYRDAEIISDTVNYVDDYRLKIHINIEKGDKYYFRNINFSGNTKYSTTLLQGILGIEKGDVYNTERLQQKLFFNPSGLDISSLYMDNGYLFFNVEPVELSVENDSVDIEIRIQEGPQATVDEVMVTGNTKTSDHVILREIRTRPGDKFSRSEIIRSQRELSQLGFFDPEQIEIVPQPDPQSGTVDLEYKVVEKPTDQFELQGGYGNGQLVGSLGFTFNNFSLQKLFEPRRNWNGPLPSGDGQRLSLRGQTNGKFYTSLNFSFTEPWFGGRKPNSLTLSAFHSVQSNGRTEEAQRQVLKVTGVTVGLGKRLKWPDDFFSFYNSVTLQQYDVQNFQNLFSFSTGTSYTLNFQHTISRNSIDQPIYPRRGSRFSLSFQWTPPFSLFNDIDYENATAQQRYKWIEYHKTKFDAEWYLNIVDKLVLSARANFGFLGYYNPDIGLTPFERFYVGGSGLTGFQLDGRELIRLRGYPDRSITNAKSSTGSSIFNKFTFELRYPISLNPSATVYLLTFAEGGNAWREFDQFDPFNLYRSAGAGIRVFLPMFGLLGFDWGFGFDQLTPGIPKKSGEFHIVIGQQF